MIALPPAIAPPAPFPLVVSQVSAPEFVAPGIARVNYRLMTSDGPLVVYVVGIDPENPTVRLGTVVAHDRMISSGETISAMARRTHAVAGINADYFDITNTNQPLNIVVRDGALQRTPSKRVALSIGTNHRITMGAIAFGGTLSSATATWPLTTVNEWPPQGGVALLTPAYGTLTASPGVQVAHLTPLESAAPMAQTYSVRAMGPSAAGIVDGIALGFGKAALAIAPPPNVGDVVRVAFDTTPPAASIVAAVGGGPLLVRDRLPIDDLNAPAPDERNVRFPVSGAALDLHGALLLIVVDGRDAAHSIGLTRPQFGALMRGFGAVDGMAFDSGGSATLVARTLGDDAASVVNEPSDGVERPVADGLFAYSDAPAGVHPHLVVRPATFTALPGATVALQGAIVDDAGHRLRSANVAPLVTARSAGTHVAIAREAGGALAQVPYRIVERPAALTIVGDRALPQFGDVVTLSVQAADEHGTLLETGGTRVHWAARGRVADTPQLAYDTHRGESLVRATLDGATATFHVLIGTHDVPLPFAPATLVYDFTGAARAAATPLTLDLPGAPVAFALDVEGDASGVGLRATFVNRYGERHALTLARHVDWNGWRRLEAMLPPDLNPPVSVTSISAVATLGGPPVRVMGALHVRAATAVEPGLP